MASLRPWPRDPHMLELDGCAAVAAYAVPTTATGRLSAAPMVVLLDPVLALACLHKEVLVTIGGTQSLNRQGPDAPPAPGIAKVLGEGRTGAGTGAGAGASMAVKADELGERGDMVVGFPLVRAESAEHLLLDGYPAGAGGATPEELKIGSTW